MGAVVIEVEPASSAVGYIVELQAPANTPLRLPEGPIAVSPEYGLILVEWQDDATDDQESIDFVLNLRPVSKSGRIGRSAEVRVSHPGSRPNDELQQSGG